MGGTGHVKGASFVRTCALVEGMVNRGQISREALAIQLSADALTLLGQKIEPSLWYPMEVVDELSRILVDVEGGRPLRVRGDPENPAYFGFTCAKGRRLPEQHAHPERLLRSRRRTASDAFEDVAGEAEVAVAEQKPIRVLPLVFRSLWEAIVRFFRRLLGRPAD